MCVQHRKPAIGLTFALRKSNALVLSVTHMSLLCESSSECEVLFLLRSATVKCGEGYEGRTDAAITTRSSCPHVLGEISWRSIVGGHFIPILT